MLLVLAAAAPEEQSPQPGHPFLELLVALATFLVTPVRRDTVLGRSMHLVRANLYLSQLVVEAEDGGVQGAVANVTAISTTAGRFRVSATPRIRPLRTEWSVPGNCMSTERRSSVPTRSSGPLAQRTGTIAWV